MEDIGSKYRVASRQNIHHHLTHTHTEGIIIERGPNAFGLVPTDNWSLVEPCCTETHLSQLHQRHRLSKRDPAIGMSGIKDNIILKVDGGLEGCPTDRTIFRL